VSFAFSIPWTAKIRNGYSKSIIRDAMAPYMPSEIAYRKSKIGFNSPIIDWMQGPLKTFFLDAIGSGSFRNCELIDPAITAAKVLKVIEGSNPSFAMGEEVWTLISPYLWEQAFMRRNAGRRIGA
jgi:asparagine synthase (glutamine-hydrolysing)